MRSTVLDYDVSKIVELARQGKRIDGRALDQMREFSIQKNIAENAEGSALVTLGKTKVIAGLKMEVGTPYPDSPDKGSISIGAEALPLAHSEYESGRPSMSEIEIARVVDRGIRESKAIDFNGLCIKEGEAVWVGYLDFYVLNGDGNIFDAGAISALATFNNAKIPKLNENNKIVKHEYNGTIKLERLPVLTTFVKVGGKILLDPTYLEEKAAEARYSVSTTEDGYMAAMQKGIGGSFTVDEVNYMIEKGFEVGAEVRKKIIKS